MEFRLIQPLIDTALSEDLTYGDATASGILGPDIRCSLNLVQRRDGVVAGLPVAQMVFEALDPEVEFKMLVQDGDYVNAGTQLASIRGRAVKMVMAERTALNFMMRLGGIASMTHQLVAEARKVNDRVRITDTRKTTPGLRALEKYAVRLGGGHNHRFCLADMAMLKDNHLALLGKARISLKDAVERIRQHNHHGIKIEIEVDRLDQIDEVIASGADAILLDNMTPEQLRQAVQHIQGKLVVEASGGVTLEMVRPIAETGVDLISVGSLTHSPRSMDIGLDYF
ncbi:MAG: carboxylating nicotinate-nucleotide diphosphorylase [bacterium]|nr:carboxylating nicotinate-nucleotide diphosphorylase [bacterium]